MFSTKDEILKAALLLPLEDQLELADALLAECVPPEDFELDEAWRHEIARRSKEMREGIVRGVSLEEFDRGARKIIESGE
jgi:putative addiction module component (TIGR02574 family)